jgi:hypothetical protein
MYRSLRLLLVAVVFAVAVAIPATASAATPFDLYWGYSPEGWTSSTGADFKIYADVVDADELDYTCSLDGAVAAACGRTNSFADLLPGTHSFTQIATDGDDSETLTFEWAIDDGIGAYFYSKPSKRSNDHWPYFAWNTTGSVNHVECKLDDAAWATCPDGSVENYVSGDGQHSFSIRAVDEEGDAQSFPTTYTWTIDTDDPVITTNLPNVVTASDFELVINVDDPDAEVECELDEDDTNCDIDFSALTGTDHWLAVRARDAAGNVSYFEKEFAYQVGASVANITSHPARIKPTNSSSTFEFSTDAGATLECRINWGSFEPCTSPVTVQEFWFNEHYLFEVRAVKNGVTQSVPDSFRWFAGNRPFDLYFDGSPGEWTSDSDAEFNVRADDWDTDNLDFTCALDGAAFSECENEFRFEGLDSGTHELRVQAVSKTDGGFEEITYNWRISDLPGAWFTDTPGHFSHETGPTIYWNSSEADGWECKLDAAAWSTCAHTYYENLSALTEGEHTFQVRALNSDSETVQDPVASYTWTVDTTIPVITAAVPTSPITTDPYTVAITASEADVDIYCVLDDGPEESVFPCNDGAQLSGLSRGIHTLSMWGNDRADNYSDFETYTFDWQPATAAAPVVTPPAPVVKPTLNKPTKPKSGKFNVPYSCGDATCTVKVKFKLGKKSLSLKTLSVKKGSGKAQFKLSKSQKKWLSKKGKKKATMTVTIAGASGSSSQSLKF